MCIYYQLIQIYCMMYRTGVCKLVEGLQPAELKVTHTNIIDNPSQLANSCTQFSYSMLVNEWFYNLTVLQTVFNQATILYTLLRVHKSCDLHQHICYSCDCVSSCLNNCDNHPGQSQGQGSSWAGKENADLTDLQGGATSSHWHQWKRCLWHTCLTH